METGLLRRQCSENSLMTALTNGHAQFVGTASSGVSGLVFIEISILPDLEPWMSVRQGAYIGMQLQWATVLSTGACGDGFRDLSEGCDDGNQQDGDGCSRGCSVEAAYGCLGGGPDVCVLLCRTLDTSASTGVIAFDVARPCVKDQVSGESSYYQWTIHPRQVGRVQIRLLSYSILNRQAQVSVTECRTDIPGPISGIDASCGNYSCLDAGTWFEREAGQLVRSNLLKPEKVGWALRASAQGRFFTVTVQNLNTWDAGLLQGGFRLAWSLAANNACGDAIRDPLEACDDGNIVNGDGCSQVCAVEAGFLCVGGSATSGPDICVAPRTEISGSARYIALSPSAQLRQWVIAPPAAAGAAQVTLTACNLVGELLIFECLDPVCATQRQLPDAFALNYTSTHTGRTLRAGSAGRPIRLVLTISERTGYAVALNATKPGVVAGLFQVDWVTGATVAAGCGNSFREAGEDCDDGNTFGGDGCSVTCKVCHLCQGGMGMRGTGEHRV